MHVGIFNDPRIASTAMTAGGPHALDGIRVVDLSRAVPGPYCSMLLADMGADVVLVEEATPPSGRRAATPLMSDEEAARNALRRGKRSIRIDLKSPSGKKVFDALADRADVVLEGFRPGVVKRLGIDYEAIAARNKGVVYCSLSGYGQDGPYASLVGHDLDYIAIGGALGMIGRPGSPPAIPLNLIADLAGGGLMAAYAIVLALFARTRTGEGQYIDLAMTDGVLSLLTRAASQRFAGGKLPEPGRDRITGALPNYDVYECKDGRWLAVAPLEPWFHANLMKAIGEAEAGVTHERLRARFKEKTRDEWFALLREADTCVAPVLDLDEALADPHHTARGMRVEVEHPVFGKIPMVGPMPKLSATPARVSTAGPRPGEHSRAILEELGYRDGAIASLIDEGAVL
jgi:crotonobetainyl-CoA:carnitine CoA-transferase CaiB-like acyl-CoA transferase